MRNLPMLGHSYEDVKVENGRLHNTVTNTRPLIAHGNSSKEKFWALYNYLTKNWSLNFPFSAVGKLRDYPVVYISLYCVSDLANADWGRFFKYVNNLNFPKSSVAIFLYLILIPILRYLCSTYKLCP